MPVSALQILALVFILLSICTNSQLNDRSGHLGPVNFKCMHVWVVGIVNLVWIFVHSITTLYGHVTAGR